MPFKGHQQNQMIMSVNLTFTACKITTKNAVWQIMNQQNAFCMAAHYVSYIQIHIYHRGALPIRRHHI